MLDVANGFHIFRDGNAWCAVGPHFTDLMQSSAGFGDTPQAAVADLRIKLSHRSWWRDKALPTIDLFIIHQDQ